MAEGEVGGSVLIRGSGTIMTGTVVCSAVIAAGAGHTDSIDALCLTIVFTVCFAWLAQMYSVTLAGAITRREHPFRALRRAVASTWLLAAASLLPVGILILADYLGVNLKTAATIALLATIGLLACYGGIAGRRGGLGPRGVLICGGGGAVLGVLMIVVKALMY